jgi:hypothetical protein
MIMSDINDMWSKVRTDFCPVFLSDPENLTLNQEDICASLCLIQTNLLEGVGSGYSNLGSVLHCPPPREGAVLAHQVLILKQNFTLLYAGPWPRAAL